MATPSSWRMMLLTKRPPDDEPAVKYTHAASDLPSRGKALMKVLWAIRVFSNSSPPTSRHLSPPRHRLLTTILPVESGGLASSATMMQFCDDTSCCSGLPFVK